MQALVEERRSPALIRSSASLGQLSSPDSLPPSPSLSQLSFAGSLAGSVSYERRANRLPTLDPEHLHRMSKRKLRANAEVLHADVVKQHVGKHLAYHEADRLQAEAAARQSEVRKLQPSVLSARKTLTSTGHLRPNTSDAMLARQVRQEAIRETARDCVRREEMQRLAQMAKSATKLAERQAEAVERVEAWEREELSTRQRIHESWVARKLEYEDLRLSRALSNVEERSGEKKAIEAKKAAEEEAQKASSEARAKEREARRQAKKDKAEKAEIQREEREERNRKGRVDLQATLAANRAEALAQHSEVVWLQAQAVASRYAAELERRKTVSDALVGELDAARKATAGELERLARRHDVAERKAAVAKAAYEQNAAAAKAAAAGRRLWFESGA